MPRMTNLQAGGVIEQPVQEARSHVLEAAGLLCLPVDRGAYRLPVQIQLATGPAVPGKAWLDPSGGV